MAFTDRTYLNRAEFTALVEGFGYSGWKSITEPKANIAVNEHWEGGSLISNKSQGRVTYDNVTMERGSTEDRDLLNWFKESADVAANKGTTKKRNITIYQKNRDGSNAEKWILYNAFVVSYTPGSWDNEADEHRMEVVEVGYDYFDEL